MIERFYVKAGKDTGALLYRLENELLKLADGEYEISIKKYRKNRSLNQNRYMWGVVYKLIANHTGYSADEVHELMKERFLSYDNNGYQFTRRTSKLKTAEFEVYLENIRRFASMDLGIAIPDPNEDI